jgi:hypothetical protein
MLVVTAHVPPGVDWEKFACRAVETIYSLAENFEMRFNDFRNHAKKL